MKQYRWLVALMLGAFLLVACGGLQSAGPEGEVALASDPLDFTYDWGGQGEDSVRCDKVGEGDEGQRPPTGWMHWLFNNKGGSTEATLVLMRGDVVLGTFEPQQPAGDPSNWHFYTPFFEIFETIGDEEVRTLQAKVILDAEGATPKLVVLSDYCPGTLTKFGSLLVSKTVETSYEREHFWDIAKKVDTEFGFTIGEDETPKIWLYTDGSGDETATWTIDVTYDGFEDSLIDVEGTITIINTGTVAAFITGVDDVITLPGSDVTVVAYVDCGDWSFEEDALVPGETLVCTYDARLDEYVDEVEDGFNTATVSGTFDELEDEFGDPIAIDAFVEEPVTFGDPDVETNETVNVKDISELFGEDDLGTVTAPNGAQFTYTKDFAWEDYDLIDECGSFPYGNTASIVETGQEADALLKVNVQCLVFDGETAWAANGDVPLVFRYTQRGNWATYVEYAIKTTTLFAGQTIDVGSVSFSAVADGAVTITVTLDEPWEFEDVAENLKVQDYASAPSGNPEPGLFAHKKTCDPVGDTCSIVVPANNFYGVHVNVGQWVPDPEFGP